MIGLLTPAVLALPALVAALVALVLAAQVRTNDSQLFATLVLFHGDSPQFWIQRSG